MAFDARPCARNTPSNGTGGAPDGIAQYVEIAGRSLVRQ